MNKALRICLYISLTLFSVETWAQKQYEDFQPPEMPMDEETKMVSYNEVVSLEGVSKDDLYKRCVKWAQDFYPNPAGVLKEKNAAEGKILAKAQFKIQNIDKKGNKSFAGIVRYSLTLQFKEGRYRYEITRINWQKPSYYGIEKWMDTESDYYDKAYDYYLLQTHEKVQEIISSLKKGMADSGVKKKEDW